MLKLYYLDKDKSQLNNDKENQQPDNEGHHENQVNELNISKADDNEIQEHIVIIV
jgi:hypothetical protein